MTVADLGEGPGGAPPLFSFYFKTKLRPEGLEKIFLETAPPPYLRVWMTSPPPKVKK